MNLIVLVYAIILYWFFLGDKLFKKRYGEIVKRKRYNMICVLMWIVFAINSGFLLKIL